MMLPAILDTAKDFLFADVSKMVEAGLPEATRRHIIRLRDIYNYWLQFPMTKDRQLVDHIMQAYELQTTQAYADLRVVKALLGDLQKASKEYHRYRFIEMVNAAYEIARINRDAKSMVAAADKYAKYTQLDKEDLVDRGFDKIMIQPFKPTDDPSVAGFKPVPNIRERIQKKIASYWSEEIQEVEFESVEFNEDDIFKPKPKTDEND
ncbi:MAG: hypothetical protein KBT13_00425 [Bacteroidales bacterium]|nr:hypothetical protein [Candidatus Sodaliphilus limicaballi]